ncbi:hypothetical protein pipiens_019500 [Culex pipiens pipiens]|uniref:IPO4/5-like TPR repeats domain-containing protein n=1 Tax=Culex pipiens pipiens TaxID=38569 RepID=A0ABD1DTQ4_CULPP
MESECPDRTASGIGAANLLVGAGIFSNQHLQLNKHMLVKYLDLPFDPEVRFQAVCAVGAFILDNNTDWLWVSKKFMSDASNVMDMLLKTHTEADLTQDDLQTSYPDFSLGTNLQDLGK